MQLTHPNRMALLALNNKIFASGLEDHLEAQQPPQNPTQQVYSRPPPQVAPYVPNAPPPQRAPIDEGLERMARQGWSLGFQAVGRAQNKAAHEVASSAAAWASSLGHDGRSHPRVIIEWRGGARATAAQHEWPPWP